jgi:uncharacterized protein with HEPN domain
MHIEDKERLLHILDAAGASVRIVHSVDRETFEESELHQNATVHLVQIVGEAANRLSEEFKSEHPEIPWPEIGGMRNRLVHDYYDINLDTVWNVVVEDIPPLIEWVEDVLENDEIPSNDTGINT